jgi:hypothetical protein
MTLEDGTEVVTVPIKPIGTIPRYACMASLLYSQRSAT